MLNQRSYRTAASAAIIAGGLLLGGCLISSSSNEEVRGRPIAYETFTTMEPDVTSEEEMLGLLGPPTRTVAASNDGLIYVYEYESRRTSSGSVLLIFSGSSSKVSKQVAYVLVRDGLVVRHWLDEA